MPSARLHSLIRALLVMVCLSFVSGMLLPAASASHGTGNCYHWRDYSYYCTGGPDSFVVCYAIAPVAVGYTWSGLASSGQVRYRITPALVPSCWVHPEHLDTDPLGGSYGCDAFSPDHLFSINCTAWGKWYVIAL